MPNPNLVLVTGAGGFVGGYLVKELLARGFKVRAVDNKHQTNWLQRSPEADNWYCELSRLGECNVAVRDCRYVFNMAAEMGGVGYIETHKTECMLNVLITTHLLVAAHAHGVERFFFPSSRCIYPASKQTDPDYCIKEEDAYPADPYDGYGWEKLFSERMCRHFREEKKLATTVLRYHPVYGPFCDYDGGKEKAPAAICRKVAEAKLSGKHEIEIWGDGTARRSFMWIGDCVKGTLDATFNGVAGPLNLGSTELISVNDLVTVVEGFAGIKCKRIYKPSAPAGVAGCNADNTAFRKLLGWEPSTPLLVGMEKLYTWVYEQVAKGKK